VADQLAAGYTAVNEIYAATRSLMTAAINAGAQPRLPRLLNMSGLMEAHPEYGNSGKLPMR
jgi:hypothetical protein